MKFYMILQGALAGLITGVSLALWMAFGGPKPPLPVLPVSTEGCDNNVLNNTNKLVRGNLDDTEYALQNDKNKNL